VQITGAVLAVACAIQIVLFMILKALAGNIFSELLIISKVLKNIPVSQGIGARRHKVWF